MMNGVPGFFLCYADRDKCIQIARRLGCQKSAPFPFRYSDSEEDFARETINNLVFNALKVPASGVLRCRVGSFADVWKALNRAKAGDDSYKAALKNLTFSIEEEFEEELGRRFSAAVAASEVKKEFEEMQTKERARIAKQEAEREALELAAREERRAIYERGRKHD